MFQIDCQPIWNKKTKQLYLMNTRAHVKYKNIKSSKNGKRYSKHTHTHSMCVYMYMYTYTFVCAGMCPSYKIDFQAK